MTLVNLMHPHKARRIDDSSHQIALGDTLSVNRNDLMKIHAVWPARAQYCLSAFVISDLGRVDVVSLDGYGNSKIAPSLFRGAIRHTGQTTTHGFTKHTEQVIEARLTDRIKIIIPVIHTKHVGKHGCVLDDNVKIKVTNSNGLNVSMDPMAKPSSSDINSFSPCIIRNGPDGVTIHAWGKYSDPAAYFAPVYDTNQHQLMMEMKEIK